MRREFDTNYLRKSYPGLSLSNAWRKDKFGYAGVYFFCEFPKQVIPSGPLKHTKYESSAQKRKLLKNRRYVGVDNWYAEEIERARKGDETHEQVIHRLKNKLQSVLYLRKEKK